VTFNSRRQQKNFFFKFFRLILFEGTLTLLLKIKSHKEVTKLFLFNDRKIRIHISDYWIRIRDSQKQGCGSGSSLKPWIWIGSGLNPDPYWIRIGIQPKMLDPDEDEMNADPDRMK
jgi:hypothetical protein